MPFIKYATNHRCHPPLNRPDGSALVIGDEWQCDADLGTGNINDPLRRCAKVFRWSFDQREGNYWAPDPRM